MQERKKMDLRQIEKVIKDPDAGMEEKKNSLIYGSMNDQNANKPHLDSGSALQHFLDHIPINSIPGIKNSPVLELKTGDSVRDAIHQLYEKNVFGAPIADIRGPNDETGKFSERYIGFIDLASMVLWSLENCKKTDDQNKGEGGEEGGGGEFFIMLERNPQIGQTKVGELAKSFLWDPFFPVNLDDTLFHVLLLLSKHRLQVVPVVGQSNSQVIGFVTQNAVIQLLLQSDGLEWFDNIADKALLEFRFENKEQIVHVYGDETVAEALHILWENHLGPIAVLNRETNKLISCIRSSDVYLLLENDSLLHNIKSITVEEFVHMETDKHESNSTIERDLGALLSAGVLRLRNSFLPRMYSPVTNKKSDTLKHAMKNLAETKGSFSFLVDESNQATGMITLRDVIIQFAPPCVDSSIHGCGFFESALEQAGCRIKNGTMICDK